ncbi:MAG: hypothetical protein GY827_00205 [Cytophagales bacterium]|nr:hypothetical protein [Cytophagales bacterium]
MLKSHALYFTLVISVIIAMLCSSLLLVVHYHNVASLYEFQSKDLTNNVSSGIAYLLSGEIEGEDELIFDLFGEGKDSVKIQQKQWGVYDYGIVAAKQGTQQVSKGFLYGYFPKDDKTALYLSDLGYPLVVSGTTHLQGNCYLPKSKIKRGYVLNKGFRGTKLVNGSILLSKNTLPSVQNNRIEKVFGFFTKPLSSSCVAIQDTFKLPYYFSFADTTRYLSVTEGYTSSFLKGNLILWSNDKIVITKEQRLEDVLVIAPSIHIEEGFEGNAQFFAQDSIYIEKNCKLNYPSVVGLLKSPENQGHAYLSIGNNSIVEGMVFSYQEKRDKYQSLVKISKEAIVQGSVYTTGYLEHQGEVWGDVICYQFKLHTSSSVYENHLLDAKINIKKRSPHFVTPSLLETQKEKQVVKWLD